MQILTLDICSTKIIIFTITLSLFKYGIVRIDILDDDLQLRIGNKDIRIKHKFNPLKS